MAFPPSVYTRDRLDTSICVGRVRALGRHPDHVSDMHVLGLRELRAALLAGRQMVAWGERERKAAANVERDERGVGGVVAQGEDRDGIVD